ncbi:hypothetical protein K439DRAFT_1413979 [Ramaria rubella]|nr:hypothetical protein K439DRAFT_1413979 [Ramaria rubella]
MFETAVVSMSFHIHLVLYGQRALKFDRNKALSAGLLAGSLSGYFFSQAFLSTYLSQSQHETAQRALASQNLNDTLPDSTVTEPRNQSSDNRSSLV